MRLDNAINRGLEQPDSPEAVMALIADAQQVETDLEEQAARHQQMWNRIMEYAAGYTEFDNELVRQVIQNHGGGRGKHPHPVPGQQNGD
ncbi:hypothetical protein [Butyricicoccus sp.]